MTLPNLSTRISQLKCKPQNTTSYETQTNSNNIMMAMSTQQHESNILNVPTPTLPETPQNNDVGSLEEIMPGIYLTKDFIAWNEHNLRQHNFRHIIIIDKHIQELYYPTQTYKLIAQLPHSFGLEYDDYEGGVGGTSGNVGNQPSLKFGPDFETIELSFGQKSNLTNVLPNCYRAVRFISKAQQAKTQLLIIDCNGGEQKCVTIVVAYLMYKHDASFRDAFARLKRYYTKADLDRFYANQLYEYEPILQVQRASAYGHSCSRDLRAALSKRKRSSGEDRLRSDNYDVQCAPEDNMTVVNGMPEADMLLNPLSQFKPNVEGAVTQKQEQQHHVPMFCASSSTNNAVCSFGLFGGLSACNGQFKQTRFERTANEQGKFINALHCDNEDVAME